MQDYHMSARTKKETRGLARSKEKNMLHPTLNHAKVVDVHIKHATKTSMNSTLCLDSIRKKNIRQHSVVTKLFLNSPTIIFLLILVCIAMSNSSHARCE
jgi:hypothetical protein